MALNINVTSFAPTLAPGQQPANLQNALKVRNLIDQLINEINTHGGNDQEKFADYLSCLSQTLSKQERLQGECESKLKAAIFNFTKTHAADAKVVIQQDRFKYDEKLKSTIEKVEYLTMSLGGKYCHHFKNSLGDNKRSGVTYLTAGLGFLIGGQGLQVTLGDDPSTKYDTGKIDAGWTAVAVGGAMLFYTFVNPLRLAIWSDEPLNP